MVSGDWKAVWDAAMVAVGHQPIEIRVGIGLAAAFLALMVLEGLRANFVPRRKPSIPEPEATPAPPLAAIAEPAKPQAQMPMRAFAPAYGVAPQTLPVTRRAMMPARKRNTTRPRPHRSPRPKIRRRVAAIHSEQSDSLS